MGKLRGCARVDAAFTLALAAYNLICQFASNYCARFYTLTAHLAAVKKVERAFDKLYGVLSPEQKKVADGIILGPMGMPMGMMQE